MTGSPFSREVGCLGTQGHGGKAVVVMAGNLGTLAVERFGLRTVVVTTIAEVGTDKTVVSLLDMGIVVLLARAGALVGVLWVSPDKGERERW